MQIINSAVVFYITINIIVTVIIIMIMPLWWVFFEFFFLWCVGAAGISQLLRCLDYTMDDQGITVWFTALTRHFSSPKRPGEIWRRYRWLFHRSTVAEVRLITYLHLVPSLRI